MPDQLILLLLFGAFALLKWIAENAGRFKKEGGAPPSGQEEGTDETIKRPPIPGRSESEEERMRRFLEALGLPPDDAPPPARRVKPVSTPAAEAFPPVQKDSPENLGPPPMGRPFPKPPPSPRQEERPVRQPDRSFPKPPPPPAPPAPVFTPPAAPAPRETPVFTPPAVPLPAFSSLPSSSVTPTLAGRKSGKPGSVHRELRNREAVRRAYVLREILGPPKALEGQAG